MTVQYSVTFEFMTRPPLTHRGTTSALKAHVCVARAAKEAQRMLRPRGWSSMVVVLLERELAPDELDDVDADLDFEQHRQRVDIAWHASPRPDGTLCLLIDEITPQEST